LIETTKARQAAISQPYVNSKKLWKTNTHQSTSFSKIHYASVKCWRSIEICFWSWSKERRTWWNETEIKHKQF